MAENINLRLVSLGTFLKDKLELVIPNYQRGYAWDKDVQVAEFYNDILSLAGSKEENKDHFLGGVLSVEVEAESGASWKRHEVIDGQQRLSTTLILAAALNDALSGLGRKDVRVESRISITQQYLRLHGEVNKKPCSMPRLKAGKRDFEAFERALSESPQFPSAAERKSLPDSNQKIIEARIFFDEKLRELLKAEGEEALMDVVDAIESYANIIWIQCFNQQRAISMFQVLNNRGASLAVGDLLRASSISVAKSRKNASRLEVAWDEILADPPEQVDAMLSHYFSFKMGRRPSSSARLKEFERAFFARKTEDDVVKVVEEIVDRVKVLRKLMQGEWPYDYCSSNEWQVDRLRRLVKVLKISMPIPLLLAVHALGDERDFAEAVNMIERFMFRYKTVCGEHIGKPQNLILDAAKTYSSKVGLQRLWADLQGLIEENCPDRVFGEKLRGWTYSSKGSNTELKHYLMTLSEHWAWFAKGATFPVRPADACQPFDFDHTTIEHVYPKRAKASMKDADCEELKDSIGNLALLGPGANAANGTKPWHSRRKIYKASDIALTRNLGDYPGWGATQMEERAEKLIEISKAVWRLCEKKVRRGSRSD